MKNLFLFLFAFATLGFIGCGDDEVCDGKECSDDQVLDASRCECVDIATGNDVVVNTNITADATWTADKVYVLAGRITVTDGATLTIEAGTVIKGDVGTGVNATALLIARGGKLNAEGTAELPIIFTAKKDSINSEMIAAGNYSSPNLDPSINGLWGGVLVLGKAPISAQNLTEEDVAELQIEGIPTSDSNGLYGGSDAADNSGTISYISIRHGGANIGAGNEINGLTLGGVGSGTTISNVEVVANQDDGIEWFGGSVDVSNVVIWNSGDDALDTDQAWNGTCTDWIVVTPQGGSAMELDGPEGSLSQGANQFTNGVIYAGENIDFLVDWDGNTNSGVKDVYIFGIDADYNADGTFTPIDAFGGDGSGETVNWQYTLPAGVDAANIFTGVPTDVLSEVGANANTVGPDASAFGWSWAGHSGALSGLGL